MKWLVIMALAFVLNNVVWAYNYHKLWLEDAQANAWLDWDEQYMQDFQTHEQQLLMIQH